MTLGDAALLPVIAAAITGIVVVTRFYRRRKAEGPASWISLVSGAVLRLLAVGVVLGIVETVLAVSWLCMATTNPPARRLVDELHKGTPLAEARERAIALGFVWRVDEARLSRAPPPDAGAEDSTAYRHFICHSPPGGVDVCENFESATDFGVLFTSAACNVLVAGGEVDEVWFYMD
jgi:hypothetical protein